MFMPPVFPAHWHVSQPVLIADTFSSLVWKVSLPDGTPAIVKGLKPIEDIADELRGADYLVVAVLGNDVREHSLPGIFEQHQIVLTTEQPDCSPPIAPYQIVGPAQWEGSSPIARS